MRTVPFASVYESVREKIAMPRISRISPGIMKRENFSIPFSTPRYTTQAVKARNSSMNTIGENLEVIKDVK